MTIAKIQEALEKLDALDDLLQDVSPARIPQWNWEELTHQKLKTLRRILENELVHQEKDAYARYMQSNTGLPMDGAPVEWICACGLSQSQHVGVACEHRPASKA